MNQEKCKQIYENYIELVNKSKFNEIKETFTPPVNTNKTSAEVSEKLETAEKKLKKCLYDNSNFYSDNKLINLSNITNGEIKEMCQRILKKRKSK